MLNVNVYHPTPVISGPIALINPIAHPQKKKKKKNPKTHKVVGTQGFNQCIAIFSSPPLLRGIW